MRARHAFGRPVRTRRHPDGAGRPVRGQAVQQPERRRGRERWHGLVHRPDLRHRQLRRGVPRGVGDRRQQRVPHRPAGRRHRPDHRHGASERSRLLARRAVPVRRGHRRESRRERSPAHPPLRRRSRRRAGSPAAARCSPRARSAPSTGSGSTPSGTCGRAVTSGCTATTPTARCSARSGCPRRAPTSSSAAPVGRPCS